MIGNRNRIPFLGTCLLVSLLLAPSSDNAALTIDVAEPKVTGQKAVIEVDLKNTYTQKIESAKATMFLMDAAGKVLSQKSGWMIGGSTNRPPLAPDHQSKYYFVLPAGETFSKAKLMLNRVVLEIP